MPSRPPVNQTTIERTMRKLIRNITPALGLCVLALSIAGARAQTSGYTQYSSSYTVQNWTSGCGEKVSVNGIDIYTLMGWPCLDLVNSDA